MDSRHRAGEDNGRWAWKAGGLVVAGGVAGLGGLIAYIFGWAPSYVPLTGAALLVMCYASAAVLIFHNT